MYTLTGLTIYFLNLIDVAWECGVRVFKPQMSFYEQLGPMGQFVLMMICNRIDQLARKSGQPVFCTLDAKRGDIESTQAPYYKAYLGHGGDELVPGMSSPFRFSAMTITTWMGKEVVSPGQDFFKSGRGAIVVTRSSNPSGTRIQDAFITPSDWVQLSDKQKPHRFTNEDHRQLCDLVGRQDVLVHELMLFDTMCYSRDHNLDVAGVSPLFSVMGATVEMLPSFRQIRGNGAIALVPGFGAQAGSFDNIVPLLVRERPLAGHWCIASSSRVHNYPWMKKNGGDGDPKHYQNELRRAIASFRQIEREAYQKVGYPFPFEIVA